MLDKVRCSLVTGGTGSFWKDFIGVAIPQFPRGNCIIIFNKDELK